MNKNFWLFQPKYYIVIVLYLLWGFTTLGYGNKWAGFFYPEDHFFENIGAMGLFVASAVLFYAFVRAYRTRAVTKIQWIKMLALFGLAFLFFFGGGEEISWGQRIFNIDEPASLVGQNAQDELNIHNLEVFQDNKFFKFETLFNLFLFVFIWSIPFVSLVWKWFHEFAGKLMPIVHWLIGSLFIVSYIGAKIAKLLYVNSYSYPVLPFVQSVQEIKESNYEFLLIFVSLYILWDLNRFIEQKSAKAI